MSENENVSAIPNVPTFPVDKKHDDCPPALLEAAAAYKRNREMMKEPEHDPVNNPAHYTYGELEVIDILRDQLSPEQFEGFLRGNVLKYVLRYPHKNGSQDLQKGGVYLGWLTEHVAKMEADETFTLPNALMEKDESGMVGDPIRGYIFNPTPTTEGGNEK